MWKLELKIRTDQNSVEFLESLIPLMICPSVFPSRKLELSEINNINDGIKNKRPSIIVIVIMFILRSRIMLKSPLIAIGIVSFVHN